MDRRLGSKTSHHKIHKRKQTENFTIWVLMMALGVHPQQQRKENINSWDCKKILRNMLTILFLDSLRVLLEE